MSEHICRNCRWWEQNGWAVNEVGKDFGVCKLTCVFDRVIQHADTKAIANGYAGSMHYGADWARLATKSDFGCVQWEWKE